MQRRRDSSVKHLNPRQGITTFLGRNVVVRPGDAERVKHLNPRQGITTFFPPPDCDGGLPSGVKHLNPRQGITTVVQA